MVFRSFLQIRKIKKENFIIYILESLLGVHHQCKRKYLLLIDVVRFIDLFLLDCGLHQPLPVLQKLRPLKTMPVTVNKYIPTLIYSYSRVFLVVKTYEHC